MSDFTLQRPTDNSGAVKSVVKLFRSMDTPGPAKKTKSIISRVVEQLKDPKLPNSISPDEIRKKLRELPAYTLEYLDYEPRNYREHPYLYRIVISALHNDASAVLVDDLAYLYRHMDFNITYYEDWTLRGFEGELTIMDTLRGIQSYTLRGVAYDFSSDTPLRFRKDDMGSKILALFEVTNILFDDFKELNLAVHDNEAKTDTIVDPVLAQLAADKHDRLEELLEIMSTRQTADPEVIASIMDADANAMRDGFL